MVVAKLLGTHPLRVACLMLGACLLELTLERLLSLRTVERRPLLEVHHGRERGIELGAHLLPQLGIDP